MLTPTSFIPETCAKGLYVEGKYEISREKSSVYISERVTEHATVRCPEREREHRIMKRRCVEKVRSLCGCLYILANRALEVDGLAENGRWKKES